MPARGTCCARRRPSSCRAANWMSIRLAICKRPDDDSAPPSPLSEIRKILITGCLAEQPFCNALILSKLFGKIARFNSLERICGSTRWDHGPGLRRAPGISLLFILHGVSRGCWVTDQPVGSGTPRGGCRLRWRGSGRWSGCRRWGGLRWRGRPWRPRWWREAFRG